MDQQLRCNTIPALLTADGGLTKVGSGELDLTQYAVNTYTGPTLVSAGVLSLGSTAAMPGWNTPNKVSVAGGAILAVQLGDGSNNASTGGWNASEIGTLVTTAPVGPPAQAFGIDTPFGSATYSGNLSLPSGLPFAKVGANNLSMTGSNTLPGGIFVDAGVLSVATTASLPGWSTSGSVNVAAGASLVVQLGDGTSNPGTGGWSNAEIGNLMTSASWAASAAFGIDTTNAERHLHGKRHRGAGVHEAGGKHPDHDRQQQLHGSHDD